MDDCLRATQICQRFGGQIVFDDVSLRLRRGEFVVLRGANGSGKSSLLDILTGHRRPTAGMLEYNSRKGSEVFRFPGSPWNWRRPPFRPETIASLGVARTWQDLRLFPNHTLVDNLALAIPCQPGENPVSLLFRRSLVRRREQEVSRQSRMILDRLGLDGRQDSSAYRISLGQMKRVAIAQAVQTGARVLFLDEPLASLDADGANALIGFLCDIIAKYGCTAVVVEHALNVPHVLKLANTVWTLSEGRLHLEDPDQVRRQPGDLTCSTFIEATIKACGPGARRLEQPLPGGALLTTVVPWSGAGPKPLLRIENVGVTRGRRTVIGSREQDGAFTGLSMTLFEGGIHLLEAPNGWGKTTLLEALVGVLPFHHGRIFLHDQAIQGLPAWTRARLGLRLMQSRNNTYTGLTVNEMMMLSGIDQLRTLSHVPPERRVSELSGGERQKLALECFEAQAGVVRLFDEPWSALDAEGLRMVGHALRIRSGQACLIALPTMPTDGTIGG